MRCLDKGSISSCLPRPSLFFFPESTFSFPHQVLMSFLPRRQLGCSKEREVVLKNALWALELEGLVGQSLTGQELLPWLFPKSSRGGGRPLGYPPLWSGLRPRPLLPICHSVALSTCSKYSRTERHQTTGPSPGYWPLQSMPYVFVALSSACPQAVEAG